MDSDLSTKIKQLLDDGRLPAVGAIALDKAGKYLFNSASGKLDANKADSKPFTNDTQMIFWSCTKFLTCIAALQMLEQGKIASLDDPVSKYLPRQSKVEILERLDAEGKPQTRPQATEMKVIHLFTHTAGYTYDFWSQLMHDYRATRNQPQGAYGMLGAEWHFHDVFLEFDPGTQYGYGISIDFLGFIVEELSGLDLPTYLEQHVLLPLGMKKTGAFLLDDDWQRCHLKSPEGRLTTAENVVNATNPWKFGGGHYIISTMNDYSQVLLTCLNEGTHPKTGNTILKPETVRDYVFKDFIPHVGCSPDNIGILGVSTTTGASNHGELLKGQQKGWSCGLMINLDDVPGGRRAGSGAWAGLGNIYYWIDPNAGKAGIFGTNVLPFLDEDALSVFDGLERLAYSS